MSNRSYQLGAGDLIEIKYDYNSETDETIMVRPDGFVSLPMIGDVHVESLAPVALAEQLTQEYARYLRHPEKK